VQSFVDTPPRLPSLTAPEVADIGSPVVQHPTLKTMMNEVVDYDSRCECGSCVLVCPDNVIDYVDSSK
jgi:NAD-dependent dihydropyrimidine dehydrogenase PreA subunit